MLSVVDGNEAYLRWVGEHARVTLTTFAKATVVRLSAKAEGPALSSPHHSSAWRRSSIRSCGSSMPVEIRTRLSVSPICAAALGRHRTRASSMPDG